MILLFAHANHFDLVVSSQVKLLFLSNFLCLDENPQENFLPIFVKKKKPKKKPKRRKSGGTSRFSVKQDPWLLI